MDITTFMVEVFCLIDDWLQTKRWRQRGPQPVLHDSEVLTMEVVGEFLGLDQDIAIYRYFRRAHPGWFPALLDIHRTTFTRQAANLWVLKERLWRVLLDRVAYDPSLSIVDSVPVPICRFGRAWGCRRFRGEAAFGRDTGSKATFYGFRDHLRVCWPGVITLVSPSPLARASAAAPTW